MTQEQPRCPKCRKRLYEGASKGNWHNCPYKCPIDLAAPLAASVESRGLGTLIERGINAIASLTGLTGAVAGMKKKGCGCDKRKKKLNGLTDKIFALFS